MTPAHRLRPGRSGPAAVDIEVVEAAKAFAAVRGSLSNAEVGDSTGRLVAQSRQLALLPRA